MPGQNGKSAGPIIHTIDVSKKFHDEFAVRDVSLDVPRGIIFGFIGPSGAGKTTTIRLLIGTLSPTSGQVQVLGRSPSHFNQSTRAAIGYMPQLFALYPDLTVWENLNFAASIYGMGLFRGKRLKQVLDFVEMYGDRRKLARDISGGMQRRLSLAATLVHNPQLLFLDEPTAGIDPVLREKFWEHFRVLRDQGRTVFVTTQYVGEAAYCDMVGIMAEGQLLIVDTPENLRRRAYGGEIVQMHTTERVDYDHLVQLRQLPFVKPNGVTRAGDQDVNLTVDEASTAIPELLEWGKSHGLTIESIQQYVPPFEDVFVKLVKENQGTAVSPAAVSAE